MRSRGVFLLVLAALVVAPAGAGAGAPYSLALGGAAKSKYLTFDAPTHSLLVAHGDEITMIDTRHFAVRGGVTGLHGARGVATTPDGHGFATNGKSGDVTMFDLRTGRVEKTIGSGADANFILYDPASRHVFAFNDDADSITVIDPRHGAAITTIALPGGEGLESAAVDGKFTLYAVHSARNDLIRIDTRTNSVTGQAALPDCRKPQGLALDLASQRAIVSCADRLLVLRLGSGEVLQSLSTGPGGVTVVFDSQRQEVFAVNGSVISVYGAAPGAALRKLADLPAGVGARSLAEDDRQGTIYTVTGPGNLLRLTP